MKILNIMLGFCLASNVMAHDTGQPHRHILPEIFRPPHRPVTPPPPRNWPTPPRPAPHWPHPARPTPPPIVPRPFPFRIFPRPTPLRPIPPEIIVRPGLVNEYRPLPGPVYVHPIYPQPELPYYPVLDDIGATTFLGYAQLNDQLTNDTVALPSCDNGDNNYVSEVSFMVTHSGAQIDWVYLTFENGETDVLEFRRNYFNAGQTSRWIDLRGEYRCIGQIEILGHSDSGNQAEILFFGR